MASENETVVEIREDVHEYLTSIGSDEYPDEAQFEEFADRFVAAHKREREAGAEAAQICGEIGEMIGRESACEQPVTNCNRLGNAAKMREALEFAEDELWSHGLFDASKRIASALSATPRNCDRFSNANEALEAFENEKRETMIEFIRWLFAEAKGCTK